MIRSALDTLAHRLWNDELGTAGAMLDAALAPAEILYRGIVAARNAGYDRGVMHVEKAAIPVISVGNIATGGTGKTPFSHFLADRLIARGERPAILHGGYEASYSAIKRTGVDIGPC